MPYRLDLTALNKAELERLLPREQLLAVRVGVNTARMLRRPMLSPDEYPDALELAVAEEEDWDALGASVQDAVTTKAYRDSLHDMGFKQVNAFKLLGMPYPRNFFAYVKDADTFAALYLSDAQGVKPYVELYAQFRQEKEGVLGVVTSSAEVLELDPSPRYHWLHVAGKDPEVIFQLHRSKVLEYGKANKAARDDAGFRDVFRSVWDANYQSWIARGVLKKAVRS
jgi:hypothetical protein